MRLLLINPSSKNMLTANLPSFVEEERGVYPPIGLLYVASSIEVDDHLVKVLDLEAENLSIIDEVKKFKPELIGLTSSSFNLLNALQIKTQIKKSFPNTKLVIGGVHATIYPAETLKLGFGFAVRGEGELTFKELVNTNLKHLNKIKVIKKLFLRINLL